MATTMYECGCYVSRSMYGEREVVDAHMCQDHILRYGFQGGDLESLASHIRDIQGLK